MQGEQGCLGCGCPGVCLPPWEAGADHCHLPPARRKVDQGKSGYGRDGLQLCHLQKSLRESDMLGQWQESKPLGVSETLIPFGLWRTRRTLLADGVSSPVCRVSLAPSYSCKTVLIFVLPRCCIPGIFVFIETFAETTTEMWLCAKLWNNSKWNNPWLGHGHGGERRWKMKQFLVLWAFWWLCYERESLLQGAGIQDRQGYSLHVLKSWVVQGLTEGLWLSGKWNWSFSSAWDKLPPPSLSN